MFWKKKTPPAPAANESAQRAADLWKQGAQLLEKRKVGLAIEAMEAAMELEPSRLEGRLNLGAALYLANRAEEAVSHLKYVLAFEEQNSMALLNLAACYDALGQVENSTATLETLVSARPTWKDAHYNLGVAYYKQERYEDAITALRHELALNGKNVAARELLNKIHLMPSRARKEAREAQHAEAQHAEAQHAEAQHAEAQHAETHEKSEIASSDSDTSNVENRVEDTPER